MKTRSSSLQPSRIFTVTGQSTAPTTARMIASQRSTSRRQALPPSVFVTLGAGTAEIDVDDVGAAFTHDTRGLGHDRGIVAPQLGRDRLLEPVLVDHLHRPAAADLERVGRYEFGDGQAEPKGLIEGPQGAVRYP